MGCFVVENVVLFWRTDSLIHNYISGNHHSIMHWKGEFRVSLCKWWKNIFLVKCIFMFDESNRFNVPLSEQADSLPLNSFFYHRLNYWLIHQNQLILNSWWVGCYGVSCIFLLQLTTKMNALTFSPIEKSPFTRTCSMCDVLPAGSCVPFLHEKGFPRRVQLNDNF